MVICILISWATSTRLLDYFFPGILNTGVGTLANVGDYFNCCVRTCSLDIAAQVKIMKKSLLIFTDIRFKFFVILLWWPLET
jgi:hypothetical protein